MTKKTKVAGTSRGKVAGKPNKARLGANKLVKGVDKKAKKASITHMPY